MKTVTRRQLLSAGLGAGAIGLAGCATPGSSSVNAQPTVSPASSGETVTLTYWAWLKGLQQVADIWNAQNPHIQVEVSWIPAGSHGGYQRLYSALAAGTGPDLAQIEMQTIPEFMMVNGLIDLGRYGIGEYAERFDPTLWARLEFAGGIYGVPQDSGPTALFYRPDLLETVGAEPPETWDRWVEVARELASRGVYMDTFPLAEASFFTGHAMQAGAIWCEIDDDSWVITLADEATLDVARFFDQAIDEGLVATEDPYSPWWFAAASRDEIASLAGPSWGDALLSGVSGAEGHWRVASLPKWDTGFGSSQIGGSSSAVLATSQHPHEALEFALWLNSSHEGIDALIETSGIGWSTRPDYIGTQREGPSDFFGGQSYNTEVFERAAAEQNPAWQWWPITQQSFNILSDHFRRKADGTSLVDAVVAAEDDIIDVFRTKGLTIRKGDR